MTIPSQCIHLQFYNCGDFALPIEMIISPAAPFGVTLYQLVSPCIIWCHPVSFYVTLYHLVSPFIVRKAFVSAAVIRLSSLLVKVQHSLPKRRIDLKTYIWPMYSTKHAYRPKHSRYNTDYCLVWRVARHTTTFTNERNVVDCDRLFFNIGRH